MDAYKTEQKIALTVCQLPIKENWERDICWNNENILYHNNWTWSLASLAQLAFDPNKDRHTTS